MTEIKRNNLMYKIGGFKGNASNAKQLNQKTYIPPRTTPIITPIEITYDYALFGASTLAIDEINYNSVINEIAAQSIHKITSRVRDYRTTELFNTKPYYGYIMYSSKYGALESLKQNSGEEQLSAWILCGVFEHNKTNYIVYRTGVPKAYQPNQTLNCY